MAYILTLKKLELLTVPECTPVGAVSSIDANIGNSVNRIGEKKLMKITVSSDSDITNTAIYINPALFMDVNAAPLTGIPTSYYSITYGPTYSVGTLTFCAFSSPGSPFPNQGKINALGVRPLGLVAGKYDFEIWMYYQHGYDCEGYINPNTDDNHSRFLKDRKGNPNELTISGPSVYNNTSVDFRTYVYVQHVSAPGHLGSIDINPKYGYKAGFYSQGTHGAAAYFTSPVWILTNSGLASTSFSTAVDCDVEFRCNSAAAPTALVVKMIRTDKFDQSVEQEANYELDVAEITGAGVTTTKFKTPYTGPTLVAGTTYKWTFKINKAGITIGAKYRIIAIALYQSGPTLQSTSFISPEYDANADVPYSGGGFVQSFSLGDIKTLYAGNELTCCIEERMRSKLLIQYPANQWANNVNSRLGITTINDIRRYLTDVEFIVRTPKVIPPGFTGEFYDIMDYRKLSRTGPLTYPIKTGIDLTAGTDELLLYAEWRNHYDATNNALAGYQNGVYISPGSGLDYYGGQSYEIDWILTLYYDDYTTPFTDQIVFTQKMNVNDYVSDTVLKVSAQNPAFDTKDFWCPEDNMCLQGEIVDVLVINPADYYYLIVNIDPMPGNIATIEEAEAWVPTLPQFTTPKIFAEEVAFEDTVPLKALFCVDVTQLTIGQDYKITVLAKRS